MSRKLVLAALVTVFGVCLWGSPAVSAHGYGCQQIIAQDNIEQLEVPVNHCTDGDGDGVLTSIENGAPAHESTPAVDETPATPGNAQGDHNADGTQDSLQSKVASLPNPNDAAAPDSYVTLEVLTPGWNIKQFATTNPEEIDPETVPTDSNFPVGLFDIKLENESLEALIYIQNNLHCSSIRNSFLRGLCNNLNNHLTTQIAAKSTVQVRLLFDRVLDHSDWTVQQYIGGAYTNYDAVVTDEVVGFLRTTITWTLKDGGTGDLDGVSNGKIVDPIGPSVKNVVTRTPAVVTPAVAVNPHPAPAKAATLANTGTNLFVTLLAAMLIAATIYVARSKQTA